MSGEKKQRKKPVRRCWARVGWVDVGERRFMFSLTQEGLKVHQKGCRKKGDSLVPFDRLTNGGGHEWKDGITAVRFCVTGNGVEIRRGGSRTAFLVSFPELSNLAKPQPELPL